MIRVNVFTGQIDYVVAIYLPEKLPLGCDMKGNTLFYNKEAMKTAIQYYYEHACEVVRDSQAAETYRAKANLMEIEKKKE